MHSALSLLLVFRMRAAFRKQLRKLKTVRGWSYLILGCVTIFLLFNNETVNQNEALGNVRQSILTLDLQGNKTLLTAFLSIMCLVTLVAASGPAIYFSPAETNHLFPGPFSRRNLLVYKFGSYVAGLVITTTLVAFFARNQSLFASVFVGTLNAMLFIQLVATQVSLFNEEIRFRGIRFIRFLAIVVFAAITVILIWKTPESKDGLPAWILVGGFPFLFFTQTILATQYWPELIFWGILSSAVNAILFGFLLWKNIDFRESITTSSQQIHQRWQRANRTGVWSDASVSNWKVPLLFGRRAFGITAWRQMTNAFRTFRGSLLKLAILAALFGPLISMLPRQLAPLSLGLSISLAIFLLPKIITFDFRSDWDYMINLRALPVPPWKIALGQLVTPVLITSTIEMIGLLGMLPFVSVFAAKNLLWIGTLLIPLNTLIFASDNLIFLLFPAPLTPIGRMDFEFFGRSLIEFVVRTIVLTLAIVLGLVIGSFLTSQIHHRGLGFLLGFWLSLAMTIGLIIPGMSWAFQRFETH